MAADRSVEGANLLVTGANRGVGAGFVEAAIARGAAKVYAGARDPASVAPLVERLGDRVVPVRLDVERPDDIIAAAAQCRDVDMLVSNAGITYIVPFLETNIEGARRVMEVNFFGPLQLLYAFAGTLRERQGGFIYVLSMAALLPARSAELYSASKAAGTMLGHAARGALGDAGVHTSLVYPGFIDTDMGSVFPMKKASPRQIADRSLDGWQAGDTAIFPDLFAEMTRDIIVAESARMQDEPDKVLAELVTNYVAATTGG